MKYAPAIVGALLGVAFVVFGMNHFLNFIPMPKDAPPPTAGALSFMQALLPSGYMSFVKCVEVLGGLLMAIPKTRNIGLLVLGPVLVNIFAFHIFLNGGLKDPVTIALGVMALFLLWSERKAWAALVRRNPA
jgi:putative oxidoreductase